MKELTPTSGPGWAQDPAPHEVDDLGYRELNFSYGGVRFACRVAETLYDDQVRHLAHYLPPQEFDEAYGTHSVRITHDDDRYRQLLPTGTPSEVETAFGNDVYAVWPASGTRWLRPTAPFPPWVRDDHLFGLRDDETEIVTHSGTVSPCAFLMNVVREVLLRVLEDHGGVLFHAACVSTAGMSALIVGEKAAGKTTTLSALVAGGTMSFAANDRTFVTSGPPRTIGVPIALRLGYGLVEGTPTLRSYISDGRLFRPQLSTGEPTALPEVFGSRVKHVLTPAEYCAAMGTELTTGGRLSMMLLPAISDDSANCWSHPVSGDEVTELLMESCYTPDDPAFVRPRFRTPVTDYQTRQRNALKMCRDLARQIPAFRVGWGVHGDPADVRNALAELWSATTTNSTEFYQPREPGSDGPRTRGSRDKGPGSW